MSRKLFKKGKFTKYLALSVATVGMLYVGSSSVSAAEKPVDIEYLGNSIELNINESGDHFEVYKEGKLIYQGKDSNFIDTSIKDGQRYKVGVYKDGKLQNVVSVKTNEGEQDIYANQMKTYSVSAQTNSNEIMKESVSKGFVESTATKDSVTLNWSELPDTDGIYEVYRDSEKIGETSSLEFTDNNVTPDKRYTYDIIAKLEINNNEKDKINAELKKQKITPSKKQLEILHFAEGALTKAVDTPTDNLDSLKSETPLFKEEESEITTLAFPTAEEFSFTYNTFIPQKTVGDPYSPGNYLKGDNRGYDPYSNKYRTQVGVNVGFWMPYMVEEKLVGPSTRCDDTACTKVLKTGTASNSGIKVTKDIVKTNQMRWRVNHDVGVPFSAAYPNITYYYDANLTKTSLNVTGSHDRAPAHEFYMFSATSSSYNTITRYTVDSSWEFGMLIPGAPQRTYKYSL